MRIALFVAFAVATAAATQTQAPSERPGRVTGRVVRTTDGAPLGKVIVVLASDRQGEVKNVRTGADGTFDLREVAPGEYEVRATRTGYVQERIGDKTTVTVQAGRGAAPIEIRMTPAGVITGRVTDEDGEPAEDLSVTAFRLRFSPGGKYTTTAVATTHTDDLGAYRIPRLTQGAYLVQVTNREGLMLGGATSRFSYAPVFFPGVTVREAASRIQVASGAESRGIDVAVRPGSRFAIRGVVVDAAAPGERRLSIGFAIDGGMLFQFVDARDGSFTIPNVEPGDYTLVATSTEGKRERYGYQPVTITDGDINVVVEVGRGAELGGEVRLLDGSPVPDGLTIRLLGETEIGRTFAGRIRDGAFTIADLPDGNYRLELSGETNSIYIKAVRCGGDDVTHRPVRVSGGRGREECRVELAHDVSSVSGTVMRDTTPATDVVVVLIPADPDRRRLPRHTLATRTNAAGQFALERVIPGDYLAFAVLPSDDDIHFDLEFPERHRSRAVRLTVGAAAAHTLGLNLSAGFR